MVAVTPPNYGQGLHGVVTMHDVVHDLFLRQEWIAPPPKLAFWEHIFPLFARLVGNQWVNQGIYFLFGAGSPSDLTDPEYLEKLASPDSRAPAGARAPLPLVPPAAAALGPTPRRAPTCRRRRRPDLPPFYGDGIDFTDLPIYDLRRDHDAVRVAAALGRGGFRDGERGHGALAGGARGPPAGRAAGRAGPARRWRTAWAAPFHPGIELTWPMRVPSMWRDPAMSRPALPAQHPAGGRGSPRTTTAPSSLPRSRLGPAAPGGERPGHAHPLAGRPLADRRGELPVRLQPSNYLSLPSFWAARVPNQVLAMAVVRAPSDAGPAAGPEGEAPHLPPVLAARPERPGAYQARINNMVTNWHAMGIIAEQPVPPGATPEPGWPHRYWVETGRAEKLRRARSHLRAGETRREPARAGDTGRLLRRGDRGGPAGPHGGRARPSRSRGGRSSAATV